MQTFSEYLLTERYLNAIDTKPDGLELKQAHVDEVWDILYKSYAKIGGMIGGGFRSKQDMIDNIPFWKMVRKNGKIIAVVMYKDRGGRKRVAAGTDGTEAGKIAYIKMAADEPGRSYGEVSKAALSTVIKNTPPDIFQASAKTPAQAAKILGKKVIPLSKMNKKDIDKADLFTLDKYPQIKKFMYFRMIGDEYHGKVMVGKVGKTII